MTPIHVELPRWQEAESLAEFLSRRGLTGTLSNRDDHFELEVQYALDPEELFRRDFENALWQWLPTVEEPLVPARGRGHEYVLRPPGD